jgi:hypothetical protein
MDQEQEQDREQKKKKSWAVAHGPDNAHAASSPPKINMNL